MLSEEAGQLVRRCIEGDQGARARLYADYKGLVQKAVARRLATNTSFAPLESDVEDICHDVFSRIIANDCAMLATLRNPSAIHAWLVAVSSNSAIDYVRKQGARKRATERLVIEEPVIPNRDPAGEAMCRERCQAVRDGLQVLPHQDRLILKLFFVEGMKYIEIAELMGMNINTVSARIRRAKRKLLNLLEAHPDVIER